MTRFSCIDVLDITRGRRYGVVSTGVERMAVGDAADGQPATAQKAVNPQGFGRIL